MFRQPRSRSSQFKEETATNEKIERAFRHKQLPSVSKKDWPPLSDTFTNVSKIFGDSGEYTDYSHIA